jgi:hypothetical protein
LSLDLVNRQDCRVCSDHLEDDLVASYSKQLKQLERCKYVIGLVACHWDEPTRTQFSPSVRVTHRLSRQMIDALVAGYASGRTGKSLADEYGISRDSVFKLVRREGGKVRFQRLTEAERKRIQELYSHGVPQVDIARQTGCLASTIWHVLNPKPSSRRLATG